MVQAMPRRHRQSDIMRRRFIEADDEMGEKTRGRADRPSGYAVSGSGSVLRNL